MKKITLKALTTVSAMALLAGASVVAANTDSQAKKVSVKKVKATTEAGKTAYVAKGKKVKITTTVTVKPNKKGNKKVTYKTSNKKVATVSSKGYIKGVKAGKAKITVVSKKNKKKKAVVKVVVKKAAVKKVKLNTGNFNLAVGSKKSLKATITPKKKVSKKVVWKTSNKKVATVTSKGVVKGVGEGTATITCKATDGSGKKASVKVTVGAGIASVSVDNGNVIHLSLTSAKALNLSDIQVDARSSQVSKRYINLSVSQIHTADKKNYDIIMEDYVDADQFLRVTVKSLKINKTVEIYVERSNSSCDASNDSVEYITENKDDDSMYSDSLYISNSRSYGKLTYSISGLPSGLKAYYNKNKTSVKITGFFNNIERGTTATLTGVDEKGATFTKKLVFYVGSDSELVSYSLPARSELTYKKWDSKDPEQDSSGFNSNRCTASTFGGVAGGSGSYDYTITVNGKNVNDDDFNNETFAKAGSYTINIAVTDSNNDKLKTSYSAVVNLVEGVTISGSVKDLAGTTALGANVYAESRRDSYGRDYDYSADVKSNGTYSLRVVPETYTLFAYCDTTNAAPDTYPYVSVTTNANYNFTIPAYMVTFNTNISGAKGYSLYRSIKLLSENGASVYLRSHYGYYDGNFNLYAYLTPGTYDIISNKKNIAGTVTAYGKIDSHTTSDGCKTYSTGDDLGEYNIHGGSFTVNANNRTATLTADKVTE